MLPAFTGTLVHSQVDCVCPYQLVQDITYYCVFGICSQSMLITRMPSIRQQHVCVFVDVVLSVINYQHSLSVYHCWSVSCHGVMGMLFV
jgi:hypothetical protein